MSLSIKRTIVIGMLAALSILSAACDDLNTGLVKRGYSYLVNYSLRWANPADSNEKIDPGTTTSSEPKVAMDKNGNAIIVWTQAEAGGRINIYKCEYRNGTWICPSNIEEDHINVDDNIYNVESFAVAMADDGSAIIAWLQEDNTGPVDEEHAWVYLFHDGVWSFVNTRQITSTDTTNVQVAIKDSGKAYVSTVFWNGLKLIYELWISEININTGINVDNVKMTSDASTYPPEGPQIAMDRQGDAIVVWQESVGGKNRICLNEFRGTAWSVLPDSPPNTINFDSGEFSGAYLPQVAMSSSGSAIITWRQDDSTGMPHIFYSLYNGIGWDHPASASDNRLDQAALGENGGTDPQVAMDSKGDAVAVWTRQIGGWFKIQKAELRNGTWVFPGLLDHIDPAGTVSTNPRVAMGGDDAVIAWRQLSLGWYHMYKAEYRHGSWLYPKDLLLDRLDPEGTTDVHTLSAAMSTGGEAIIVWDQIYNAPNRHIYKSECRPYLEILPFLY